MGFQGNLVSDIMKITGGGLNAYYSLGLLALFVAWLLLFTIRPRSAKLLPPGPPALPIIGNLHMLGKLPHRNLRDIAQKYGPLMFLRLGSVPTVVASSPEMAEQFLKTHDLNFAGRPSTTVGKNMIYNSTDIGFSPYGPYWRTMRKVCVLELFSPKRLELLKFVRKEEICALIHSVTKCSLSGEAVNVSKLVSAMTTDIICRMACGKKYCEGDLDSRGFKDMIKELFFLLGAINIGDFIPWLEWMDLQGLRRRQKSCHNTFDAFFEMVIEEHVQKSNDESADNKDFVDVMLGLMEDDDMEIKITRDNIKAVIFDMLGAGTDTSSATLEWAMSEMLLNPSMMRKVQEELESVVGLDRRVEESDLPRLDYLKAVVKETLRLHPPGPLLIPHESFHDCTVGGYFIPGKSRLLVNVWALARDPNSWEYADVFKPERFIGSPIDIKGQHFQVIPFGAGRRGCPAQSLGLTVVEYALASLLQCFDWKLPNGMKPGDLDMTEELGLSTPRSVHLVAVPTLRLKV
jgi:cytochrome P450